MKKCPFCAEEVQSQAIVCKHCQSRLTGTEDTQPSEAVFKIATQSRPIRTTPQGNSKKQNAVKGCLGCLGIVFILLFLGLVFFFSGLFEEKQFIFDIPTLLHDNIKNVQLKLGEPIDTSPEPTKEALAAGTTSWSNVFQKDGFRIAVTYNIQTGLIESIFLSKAHTEEDELNWLISPKDKPILLQAGNLKENSSDYTAEFKCPLLHMDCTGFQVKTK